MIFDAFFKSLGQLSDTRFLSVTLKGIGLTLALLFAMSVGLVSLIGAMTPDTMTLPILGEVSWFDNALSIGSIFLMFGLSIFLMVPVASAFTGIFLDEVAEAVEDKHYPHLPEARSLPLSTVIADSFKFLGVLLLANVVALILYLMFSFAAPFIFWAMNGYLLGREYFEMVAIRRLDRKAARRLRKKHGATIWFAGAVMAMGLSVPILNLLIPVLGAATYTHIFMRLKSDTLAA